MKIIDYTSPDVVAAAEREGLDVARFMAKTEKAASGCWEWHGYRRAHGYGQFWLGGKDHKAHRAAWLLFRGAIPSTKEVIHECDNPPCVNPAHLRLGTHAQNMADMKTRERGGKLKLDEKKRASIRERIRAGERRSAIAADNGVTLVALYRAVPLIREERVPPTHCKRGHRYGRKRNGVRRCIECTRWRGREWARKNRQRKGAARA